jgi:hypothetical protein
MKKFTVAKCKDLGKCKSSVCHFEETMKDISQVLREKERDILRVRHEIEALNVVIPLLAENTERIATSDLSPLSLRGGNRWPLEIQGLH